MIYFRLFTMGISIFKGNLKIDRHTKSFDPKIWINLYFTAVSSTSTGAQTL